MVLSWIANRAVLPMIQLWGSCSCRFWQRRGENILEIGANSKLVGGGESMAELFLCRSRAVVVSLCLPPSIDFPLLTE